MSLPVPGSRLVPPFFHFVWEEALRSRSRYLVAVLAGFSLAQLIVTIRAGDGTGGFGPLFILAALLASAPLCRSWLDEDTRLGYAAFWLQKPLGTLEIYTARLASLVAWSLVATLALTSATLPAALFGPATVGDSARALFGLGWIPPLLVVLSFLGSALGARNSGLFAYGLLLGGFALPGLRDALGLGPAYRAVQLILPPVAAALAASETLPAGRYWAAAAELLPMFAYAAAAAALGLGLALRVPRRLVGGD